jgi:uncharacterized membrane protein (DUF106 family)
MSISSIIILVLAIVASLFVVRFLLKFGVSILKFVLLIIVAGALVYLYDPTILYNVFGKDKVEQTINETREATKDALQEAKKATENLADTTINK